MSWREDLSRVRLGSGRELIGASYRGVPFFVEASERGGGRRVVSHEYPLRDLPGVEDLGRRARSLRLDGYVLGADYLAQRDALLAALEDTSGPGELVHPYYGVLRAICASLSVRESTADGGLARFAVEFVEAPPAPPAPTDAPALALAVSTGATLARTGIVDELAASYDVAGQPSFALASLAADLVAIGEELHTRAEVALLALGDTEQARAALDGALEALTSGASLAVRDPAEALAALQALLDALADALTSAPRTLLAALLAAHDVAGQPHPAAATATRQTEAANQDALGNALRAALATEAARLVVAVTYETLDDALADRDAVADRLEARAAVAGDLAYPGLVTLRSHLVRAVPGTAALSRLVTVELPTPLPSLVLAQRLYGSSDEADAIAVRNRAQHPGFLSGALEVLAHG